MDPSIQAKFKPAEPVVPKDFSDAKVGNPNGKVLDSTAKDKSQTSFKDLLLNSNDDTSRQRAAQKNGDALRMAKSDDEFAKMMTDKANQGNLRKPQNELDKDAFLKLFVTQMRNQDPMNPDNSSQMAAQLAQFHGLEQMMNVNKNLEKMQADEALGRAVGLINFVGKDIRLDNGKLQVAGGKLATNALVNLDSDAAKASLEVRDAAGVVVATEELGPVQAGDHKLEWDGKTKEGKPVEDGAYSFAVVATDVRAQPVNAKITSTVTVTGVDLHDGGGAFYTPLGKVHVSEVASVGAAGFSKGAAGLASDGRSLSGAAQAAAQGLAGAAAGAADMNGGEGAAAGSGGDSAGGREPTAAAAQANERALRAVEGEAPAAAGERAMRGASAPAAGAATDGAAVAPPMSARVPLIGPGAMPPGMMAPLAGRS